ncbi:carboxylesterase [Sediminibacterium sp.]|uniref:alpha/beta hydrolase n=1 Tax=Sediminibacterium sp. TaxID=1917865 RepID=UPI002737540F|nr:alpha/beta fold hydrolase [Sediminibacterium sp.]MDP3394822.1 alpha/beta fold hydrolase [Sediminibacterium sp.]MDP3568657.1 alpha/beta fold hydrolase [Sediminibacterium sp.]
MRILKWLLGIVLVLGLVYFVGPTPSTPVYTSTLPTIPSNPAELVDYIYTNEKKHNTRPNNEARIVWANDSSKQKTPYAIVYLHGFSASQEEGNPVHQNIAKEFGCNLYLARLSEHGIDTTDALINMTAESLFESAKEAYAIGKQLGEKVILMGTSTGGTLALQLAAMYPEIAGLVLYSPNIAIKDPNAWLLNNPWGLQIARLVKGSNYMGVKKDHPLYEQYWNTKYRLEATVQLEELLETAMTKEHFTKVKQPLLVLYYYKNEKEQDPVVSVAAMKAMFLQVNTASEKKKMVSIPNSGNHVMASPIQSKDIITVQKETAQFLNGVLQLKPINSIN